MANRTAVPCIACGGYVAVEGDLRKFIAQGGRCDTCAGVRKLAGKFGSLLVQGALTQRELAELKREFYALFQIDRQLAQRKAEFMQRAMEEMNKVIAEVEAQIGQPVKDLQARKKQLEAQLQTYMEESKTAEVVIRDLLVEVKEQIVNQGNRPQYSKIVEGLRELLEWSEEEMEAFVRSHYSQPQYGNVMTVTPLPPGRRKKQTPPVPGKPVASRYVTGSIAEDVLKAHKSAGGATFDAHGHNLAGQPLFAVSIYPDRGLTLQRDLTADDIEKFISANSDLLADPRNKIGTWFDQGTGANVLDVIVAIPDRRQAEELGRKYNQKAIFDLKALQEIPTGGTGESVADLPEPSQRLEAPTFGEEGYADPSHVKAGNIHAFHTAHLDLPSMAAMHMEFTDSGAEICKVSTPDKVFILTGSLVRDNGLHTMIALQAKTKESLKVADVDRKGDAIHVMVEGEFASDPNTVRAFLAERIEGYTIAEVYYDTPTRVAVELLPVEKIANDPYEQALSFFNQMAETLQNLMMVERKRTETAQMLMEQTTATNQAETSDNEEDLSLKWERHNVGGDSFGSGAQEGLTQPEGGAPMISTSSRRGV